MALVQRPFSDLITFTRASGGGIINAQGNFEWLGADTPRIDYDPVTGECRGLLIEEQRTNLLTYSSDFANAVWNKSRSTISADAITAPDGTMSADKMVEDTTASNTHLCSRTLTVTSGTAYTLSVFAKIGERSSIALGMAASGFGTDQRAAFNLVTGAITTQSGAPAAKIEFLANGWVRCSITATATASVTTQVFIYLVTAAGLVVYTGDGTSGIYIWGAQLEAGSTPSSYIPTTTAQVTRAADVASVNVLSPWFNASEGTLFVEVVPGQITTANWAAVFSNSATGLSDLIDLGWGFASGTTRPARGRVLTGGVTQTEQQLANTVESGQPIKMAIAYAANSVQTAARGVVSTEDTSAVIPVVDRLQIGRVATYGYSPGHIRSIRYYPKRLSNAELQSLTAN